MRDMTRISNLSRRRFVSSSSAALALAPSIARAQSVAPVGGDKAAEEAAKIAAASDEAEHLTIGVTIDGKGPFRFVVDTGADRSVIAEDVAESLGLVRSNNVMVEGVVVTVPAQTVRIRNIAFGPVSIDHLIVPVLPRTSLQTDGYLGLDAIDGHRVTFDFKNKTLVVGSPRPSRFVNWSRPSEALVDLRGRFGHLRALDCSADGIRTTAFIDTGAEISVGNSRLFNALVEQSPTYFKLDTVPLTGVTGGLMHGRLTTVEKIHVGSVTFEPCNIVIADMQIFDLWGLTDTPAILIGMNFLRQFAQVCVDYGRKELTFELASLVVAQRS